MPHRAAPSFQKLGVARVVHLRLVDVVGRAQLAQLVGVLPKARRQTGQVRGADGGSLRVLRSMKRRAKHIALELHEEVVFRRAAVDVELGELHARVGFHRHHQVMHLIGKRFERSANEMGAGRSAREPNDRATGIGIPVRGAKASEGGHDVDALRAIDAAGDLAGVGHVVDKAHLVAQPLQKSTRHKHASLERIFRTLCIRRTCGNGSDQTVFRLARLVSRVHQKEAARAVGVFRLAGRKTALPEQRRLLVARDTADGHAGEDGGISRHAEVARRGAYLGKHRSGDVEQVKQPRVPFHVVDVEEHGAARVGDVGSVHLALRERP